MTHHHRRLAISIMTPTLIVEDLGEELVRNIAYVTIPGGGLLKSPEGEEAIATARVLAAAFDLKLALDGGCWPEERRTCGPLSWLRSAISALEEPAVRAAAMGDDPGAYEDMLSELRRLAERGEAALLRLEPKEQTAPVERPKLTDNQAQVLRNSAKSRGWRGGWVWGSQSHTEAIFRSLSRKGLAQPRGDERFTPCYYDLTPDGIEEAMRIAEESGDDMAAIRQAHAVMDARVKGAS